MSTYPRTAWIFGTVKCQVRQVTLVEHSRFGAGELDADGNVYRPDELFDSARAALRGVFRYLKRKQAELDRQQAIIDKQRQTFRSQARIYRYVKPNTHA
jgi:predicted phosphoribosyltransferase